MNEYEAVSELVNKTGASYNEAKYAYEATGGDMLAAVIMLEKAKGIKTEKQESNAAGKGGMSGGFGKSGGSGEIVPAGGRGKSARDTLRRLCGKTVKVTGKREYFSLPLPAFAVIFAVAWEMSLPAFVISLVCGVKYTFSGENAEDVVISFDPGRRNAMGNGGRGFGGNTASPPRYYPNGWKQENQSQNQPQGQEPFVEIPRPEQQPRPMEYAGGNPLDSEDKGFFN